MRIICFVGGGGRVQGVSWSKVPWQPGCNPCLFLGSTSCLSSVRCLWSKRTWKNSSLRWNTMWRVRPPRVDVCGKCSCMVLRWRRGLEDRHLRILLCLCWCILQTLIGYFLFFPWTLWIWSLKAPREIKWWEQFEEGSFTSTGISPSASRQAHTDLKSSLIDEPQVHASSSDCSLGSLPYSLIIISAIRKLHSVWSRDCRPWS